MTRPSAPTLSAKPAATESKDAVAEGDHGAFHVFFFVVTFGDVTAGFEEVTLKKIVHEGEVGCVKGDACLLGLPAGHGEFLGIVLGGIVDAEAGNDLVALLKGVPEGDGGIHAAGK